ncbi:uncharacterized protein NPIL_58631 [Nephila pilipes]|uniref:Uncharacterized protein n=1 Tax=Nephila pilipes TaxID=299642 RepID=A0A8X6PJY5_NEPPI|nr:uncharacterized protein NPIL_58631 [Nephila pilipes]
MGERRQAKVNRGSRCRSPADNEGHPSPSAFLSFRPKRKEFFTPYLPNFHPSRANSWMLRSYVASEGHDEPHQGQHRLLEGQFITPLASLGPHLRRRGPRRPP